MPRFAVGAVMLSILSLLSPQAASAEQVVTVPGGTVIKIKATEEVSSGTNHAGDLFEIRASEPVVVDGWIVIPENARGQAEVVEAEPAGSHGHPGKLIIKYDWIFSSDGGKVKLTDVSSSKTGEGSHGTSSTATIVSTVLLGPVGLFAHNFVKGHNIVLNPSQALSCVVDGTVHIHAKEKTNQTNSYDK